MASPILAMAAVLLLLPTAVLSTNLQAAAGPDPGLGSDGCIQTGTFDSNTNYFSTAFAGSPFALPIVVNTTITNAYNFRVQYRNYYKIVADTHAGTTYLLYLCGAPKPAPKLSAGEPLNGTFEVPLTDYGMITTVPGNYLQLLGVVDQLKMVQDQLVDACLQKYVASLPPASPSFKGPVVDAGEPPFSAPNISFSATQDAGVLNRAEWVKYLGLFFNKEDRAAAVYANITAAYKCTKASAPTSGPKKTAAWLNYYMGVWSLSSAPYKLQYVRDAGGRNPDLSGLGGATYNLSIPSNVTAFHKFLEKVDVVFDETFLMTDPKGYNSEVFAKNAQLTPAESERLGPNVWSIYGTYANGASGSVPSTAWFESAVSNPQVVLEEVLDALYPDVFPGGINNTYFYNLKNGTPTLVTAADCTAADPAQQVDPTPTTCSIKLAEAPAPAGTPAAESPSATPPPKSGIKASSVAAAFQLGVLALALLALF